MHFSYGNVFINVNELCIYSRLFLQVGLLKRLRTNNGSTNQYVLLIELFS